MTPTLQDKQIALVLKINKSYQRGDIVITDRSNAFKTHMVKRVVAIGGDHLIIRDQQVYCNGQILAEDYLAEKPQYREELDLVLPPRTVFLMGDNRNYSKDSRDIGPIPVDSIIGKLIVY